MKHWQRKELFHVKHYRKPLAFLHPREVRLSVPDTRNRDNAECAPESLPEAAGLVLRMFQLYEQRPREVVSMFRSSCLNLRIAREDRPIPRLNVRASLPSQRSAPHSKPENPAMPVPRRVYVPIHS